MCEANAAGANSLFILTVCVKYVPLYHFNPIRTGVFRVLVSLGFIPLFVNLGFSNLAHS